MSCVKNLVTLLQEASSLLDAALENGDEAAGLKQALEARKLMQEAIQTLGGDTTKPSPCIACGTKNACTMTTGPCEEYFAWEKEIG